MVDDRDDGSTDKTALQPAGDELAATVGAPEALGTPTFSAATRPIEGDSRYVAIPPELGVSRYRLGELLGQGGMGEVVLAHDEQIGRDVAVKRIRGEGPSAEMLARFVREARVQGRLEHPAIVPVHDLAVDRDGSPFFVMKRVSGEVMSDLVRDATVETRRRLLRAFADVCLAIEFAHAKGIVHRDLKPSNIMLGGFGEVYVLDWGIARVVGDPDDPGRSRPSQADLALDTGETRAGTVLGTPAYMAPEQLTGERAGPAADIYALGCILFEIVAGEPLHRTARTPASILLEIEARPSSRRADAPPELDAICTAATRADPEERLISARMIGDAVQAYLDGDRDVAARRQLAKEHVVTARDALARGDDEETRRVAMRAAGRALALDPSASEAADLITGLVLRPPKIPPAAVEEALARMDTETARSQGRLAALTLVGYLGFVPLMVWSGIRDERYVIAFAALVFASMIQVLLLTRRDRVTSGVIYVNAIINSLLIGMICRIVGPLIIAPTLVVTTVMAYAAHPRFGRITVISVILAASVFVPWGLELAGLVAPTYEFVHGSIVLHSSAITFSSAPVHIAFAVSLVALLADVAILSRTMAERQRDASRRAELQAWQLRQLVSE